MFENRNKTKKHVFFPPEVFPLQFFAFNRGSIDNPVYSNPRSPTFWVLHVRVVPRSKPIFLTSFSSLSPIVAGAVPKERSKTSLVACQVPSGKRAVAAGIVCRAEMFPV